LTLPLLIVAEEVGVPFEHGLSRVSGQFHAVFDCASRLPGLVRSASSEIVKQSARILRSQAIFPATRANSLRIQLWRANFR
jgi:hypothetical protein